MNKWEKKLAEELRVKEKIELSPEQRQRIFKTLEENKQKQAELQTKQQAEQPKSKKKNLAKWKQIVIATCCLVLLVPCIVLPFVIKPEEKYYTDDDLSQVEITIEQAQSFISTNYSKYSFIFDDCEIISSCAFYENNSDKLIALSLILNKKDVPYTNIQFDLINTKNYTFARHSSFIENADITEKENYTLYQIEQKKGYKTNILSLLEYKNYRLYLEFKNKDNVFLEKFL